MRERFIKFFCTIINAVIIAGVILIFTGLYYLVIKAGIPYQDAPLELQIEYAVNMGIGNILVRNGFLVAVGGGIIRLIIAVVLKSNEKI